jgi:hypothetical protein
MISEQHLQISEILAFRERRLSATEHTAAAHHLLQCSECRAQLPLPTTEEFWNCLMGGDERTVKTKGWIAVKSYLANSLFGRSAARKAVLVSTFLAAVAGLSLSLVFNRFSEPADNMVAVVADKETTGKTLTTLDEERPSGSATRTDRNPDEQVLGATSTRGNRRSAGTPLSVKDRRPMSIVRAAAPERTVSRNVDTRGSNVPCGANLTIGLETTATGSAVRLIWGKVKGAVSYEVFLSDLDAHLVDNYETTDGTAYTVTRPLDPDKIYRWKLLVTLRDGKTIVGTSENFKVKADTASRETLPGIVRFGNKKSASVRCVGNK